MTEINLCLNFCALFITLTLTLVFLLRKNVMTVHNTILLLLFSSAAIASAISILLEICKNKTAVKCFYYALILFNMLSGYFWISYFASVFSLKKNAKLYSLLAIGVALTFAAIVFVNEATGFLFSCASKNAPWLLGINIYSSFLYFTLFAITTYFVFSIKEFISKEVVFLFSFIFLILAAGITFRLTKGCLNIQQICIAFTLVSLCFMIPTNEELTNPVTGLMTKTAFENFYGSKIKAGEKLYCLAFYIHDAELLMPYVKEDQRKLTSYIKNALLKEFKRDCRSFRFYTGLYLITVNKGKEETCSKIIKNARTFFEKLKKENKLYANTKVTVCPFTCPEHASSMKELNTLLSLIEEKGKIKKEMVLDVNELDIENMRILTKADNLVKTALKENRLLFYFQPIYSIKEKCFSAMEAFLRMTDYEGNFIPPSLFVPLAERNGSIIELGNALVKYVCNEFSKRQFQKLGIHNIALNLSVTESLQDNFVSFISRTAKNFDIPNECFNFEIKEISSGKLSETFEKNITKLTDEGFKLSLDNFGGGHLFLHTIMDFPISAIKINRSIAIPALSGEKNSRFLFESCLDMAHQVGKKVVVQGIETKEMALEAVKLNIDYIQGYYFAKPMPIEEFEEFIKSQREKSTAILP